MLYIIYIYIYIYVYTQYICIYTDIISVSRPTLSVAQLRRGAPMPPAAGQVAEDCVHTAWGPEVPVSVEKNSSGKEGPWDN